MKLARVVGKISLVKVHPTLVGRRWIIAQPLSLAALADGTPTTDEEVIIADDLGATSDSMIAFTDGREAAAPFEPERKPIDAYNACLIDSVSIDGNEVRRLRQQQRTRSK